MSLETAMNDLSASLSQAMPWVGAGLAAMVVYVTIALWTGCPYCMYPNMAWPVDLVRAVSGGDSA